MKAFAKKQKTGLTLKKSGWNQRQKLLFWLIAAVLFLMAVCIGGMFLDEAAKTTDFSREKILLHVWHILLERTGWEEICLPVP